LEDGDRSKELCFWQIASFRRETEFGRQRIERTQADIASHSKNAKFSREPPFLRSGPSYMRELSTKRADSPQERIGRELAAWVVAAVS
jgi:hypothetical protein